MKQKIIVITIAAVLGLAGGYFIFSGNAPEMTETHNHSETTTQNQMWNLFDASSGDAERVRLLPSLRDGSHSCRVRWRWSRCQSV